MATLHAADDDPAFVTAPPASGTGIGPGCRGPRHGRRIPPTAGEPMLTPFSTRCLLGVRQEDRAGGQERQRRSRAQHAEDDQDPSHDRLPSVRAALRFRGGGAAGPQAHAVADHDDEERQRRQPDPEQDRPSASRSGSSRGSQLGQLPPLSERAPARRLELVAPVAVGDRPDLEAALAVRAVELQAHGSPGHAGQAPAEGGHR